jgi:hypothetical protein
VLPYSEEVLEINWRLVPNFASIFGWRYHVIRWIADISEKLAVFIFK